MGVLIDGAWRDGELPQETGASGEFRHHLSIPRSFFTRNASGPNQGQILTMLEPTANLGRIDVKGVDFALNYRLPEFSFGHVKAYAATDDKQLICTCTSPLAANNPARNSCGGE